MNERQLHWPAHRPTGSRAADDVARLAMQLRVAALQVLDRLALLPRRELCLQQNDVTETELVLRVAVRADQKAKANVDLLRVVDLQLQSANEASGVRIRSQRM